MKARPQNLSEAVFSQALRDLASVVGETNILTVPDRLREYADPFGPQPMAHAFAASAAVLPASIDEIREVLKVRIPAIVIKDSGGS